MQKISEADISFQFGEQGMKVFFKEEQYELGIMVLPFEGESGIYLNKNDDETMICFVQGSGTVRINDVFVAVNSGDVLKVESGEMYNIICSSDELKAVYLKRKK